MSKEGSYSYETKNDEFISNKDNKFFISIDMVKIFFILFPLINIYCIKIKIPLGYFVK